MSKFFSGIIFKFVAPHLDHYIKEREHRQVWQALRRAFPTHSDEQLSRLIGADASHERP